MLNTIKKKAELNIKNCLGIFEKKIRKIRTNCVTPDLLDDIRVNYYGSLVPLRSVANITTDGTRMLQVSIFDEAMSQSIEKAIIASKLGLNPLKKENKKIHIPFPVLSTERRKELIKIVRNEGERARIMLRSVRHDANQEIKKLSKDKKISRDDAYCFQDVLKKIIDKSSEKISVILSKKELELKNK